MCGSGTCECGGGETQEQGQEAGGGKTGECGGGETQEQGQEAGGGETGECGWRGDTGTGTRGRWW